MRQARPSIPDLVRGPAQRRPGAVAIDGDGNRLTYAQLWRNSGEVAAALMREGLRPGDRVAYLERNASEYWEVLLGALRAGLVLVPLNFRLAPDELSWILSDAGVRLVFAGPSFAVPDGVPVVPFGDEYVAWHAAAEGTEPEPAGEARGDELVMLMYSSGTTGRPKGVQVTAGQLSWTVGAFGACFGVDEDSVSLVPTPYYHIAGAGWSLITLSVGGRIVQLRDPTPDAMLDFLVRYRVTHAAMVPALIQLIADSPAARTADLSALRQIVYGASPVNAAVLERARAVFGAAFNQSYGLTETTGVATVLGPSDHDPAAGRLHTAGRALSGMDVAVVDPSTGEPVPPGVDGEIVVRGPAVTPGYWQRPAETESAFLPGGWLRTGDVGAMDADGYLAIRDRLKDMIVSGGENVYPAEVEGVLAGHPDVADVAVIGVPSQRWGETPLAVLVPRPGRSPEAADIIDWARQRMAHYKCPSSVAFVDVLPRNPSGKVLKRVLREPYWAGHSRAI